MAKTTTIQEVQLQEVQPKVLCTKLPLDKQKCPLIVSEQGNATTLYRYADAGPFVDLFDPLLTNLLAALKYSIIHGKFCIFNFGPIDKVEQISPLMDRLKQRCSEVHKDLYNHIINNSLTKQPFQSIMSLIPFDPQNELVPQIYETSRETFRILFFTQTDLSTIKSHSDNPILSLFDCICIKP